MNVLAYFGQQNIQAGVASGASTTIDSQTAMNGITYSVNADPLADNGTWKNGGSGAFGVTLNTP